jgi:hypothetical protein
MPGHLAYAAHVATGGTYLVSTSTTATVTATPNDPNAKITVNGAPTTGGKPSEPITMNQGPSTIDVVVTASDGVTQGHYTIAAFTAAADYIKASNTTTFYDFGKSIALSADGKTLAVGSDRDGGSSSGINGTETKSTTPDSTFSGAVYVFTKTAAGWAQQAYVKASNSLTKNFFGTSVALSSDGNTMAVGAVREGSKATGIDGDQTDTSASNAGAVYVFVRSGTTWTQQAYVKASNTRSTADFGCALALSSDGNTLAVGSYGESSASTGVNQSQADGMLNGAGAAYVFTRTGATWAQEAYIKASNTRANALFGWAVALSGDGNTLAVGSYGESSSATTIGGSQADAGLMSAGAVYVFLRTTGVWAQQEYVKPTNTAATSYFGDSVALSSDGNTMAVAEPGDASNATGIDGSALDTSAMNAGSVFVYARVGVTWSQQAYVKSQVTRASMSFGTSLAITPDGNTLAIGAIGEASASIGLGGNPNDSSAMLSGAAYEFKRAGTTWSQAAYIKSPNTQKAYFGYGVALAADAKTLAVSAVNDSSNATGVNGDESDTSANDSGAVHVF